MFHTVYVIWAILPLVLFALALWALAKPVFGVQGREYSGDYMKQALFCAVCLGIAIGIDAVYLNTLLESFDPEDQTAMIGHWVLYPGVLLAAAQLSRWFGKKDREKELGYGLAKYRR